MHIVLAGGSGFLGRPLLSQLKREGHQVTQLVRRPAKQAGELSWTPGESVRLPDDTAAVINLCGVGVGDKRWTDAYRKLIRSSRVIPTKTLVEAVTAQRIPVLLNASGVGYYAESPTDELTESAPVGEGFLADVSVEWEAAAMEAAEAGVRVALLRTGLPLHADGGFLKPQLLPFKLGVGGRLGSGRQWVPWIALEDWLAATATVLADDRYHGPVNLVAPQPVTNAEFTKALGAALHRPTLIPIPKVAIDLLYGAFADEAFRSFRVVPRKLLDNGFTFRYPDVRSALRDALA